MKLYYESHSVVILNFTIIFLRTMNTASYIYIHTEAFNILSK